MKRAFFPTKPSDDLSVTALYTSQVWMWGGLSHAHLLATPEAKRVFDVTNAALAAASAFRRGIQPLRYALLHRHVMIDHLLRTSRHRQVIELAAGLSRRGASCCDRTSYTELDLPPVIAKKRQLLARTAEGRAVLAKLRLVEGDALTIDLGRLVDRAPVFVIAEGLAMYLATAGRRQLFEHVAALAEEAGEVRFVFDLVPATEEPGSGLVGRTLEAAMKQFTGGRTFERDARTREQVLGELRAAGFDYAEAIAPADVARDWQLPEPERRTTMVVFSASRTRRL